MKLRSLLVVVVLFTAVIAGTAGAAQAAETPQDASQDLAYTCWNAPVPRLVAGHQGRVTPGLPNVIRTQPGRGWNSAITGQIPGGGVFTVVGGHDPQCADNMYWWYVNYNGVLGWTAEGQNYTYWLEPIVNQPADCGVLEPRLFPGQQGRVTPGLPNVIRTQPGRGWNSQIVGQIPGGGVFTVLYGYAPQCAEGMQWWYVNYNGIVGWTPEGQGHTYWTEPYGSNPGGDCMTVQPRLFIGAWGRVTPGLPNTLRANATSTSRRVGSIPAGGLFRVVGGPYCSQGITWWEVNYNGLQGYTGEGRYGTYWTELVS